MANRDSPVIMNAAKAADIIMVEWLVLLFYGLARFGRGSHLHAVGNKLPSTANRHALPLRAMTTLNYNLPQSPIPAIEPCCKMLTHSYNILHFILKCANKNKLNRSKNIEYDEFLFFMVNSTLFSLHILRLVIKC